jgi:hypothetical protein
MVEKIWGHCSVESAIHVRTHGMTPSTLAGAPGNPVERNVDSAACAIVCPPQGLGLAGSLCWFCLYDSDVEL